MRNLQPAFFFSVQIILLCGASSNMPARIDIPSDSSDDSLGIAEVIGQGEQGAAAAAHADGLADFLFDAGSQFGRVRG